ncbi:MAG: MazG-like family protein [Peptoniphilus harei]|nr:MazG-like family protein [Peptoniphilus harei]
MFEKLSKKIIKWADDKDLLHEENADKQFMKFVEEVFEFKTEMDNELSYTDPYVDEAVERMELEMGDIFVTLIILCEQLGINVIECLEKAYKKIEARTGKTINGTFVKSEDL